MSNVLVIGSCRVYGPCNTLSNVHRYPGGLVHTPRQILQSIDVMNRDIIVEECRFRDIFRISKKTTIKNIESVQLDLDPFDKFIIEISSLTDFIFKDLVLQSFKEDISVPYVVYKYTLESLMAYLLQIKKKLKNKPILFVRHNTNFTNDRYMLGYALSMMLQTSNNHFLEPLKLISKYGMEKTMTDMNHYTDFMIREVRDEILKFIGGLN